MGAEEQSELVDSQAITSEPEIIRGPWERELEASMAEDMAQIGSPRPRSEDTKLSPDQYRQVARDLFKRAFREPQLSLDDLVTQRSVITWRIVRFWGSWLGLIGQQGTCGELLRSADPYQLHALPHMTDGDLRVASPRFRKTFRAFERRGGLPLLLRPGEQDDQLARDYRDLLVETAEQLGIPGGSHDAPRLGKYGLRYLSDEDRVAQALPTPNHICVWESLVVERILDHLVKQGADFSRKWLHSQFGLGAKESFALINTARTLAVSISRASEDQDRAVVKMRLEQLYQKSHIAEPRVALGATKLFAQISGLTRHEGPDGEFEDELKIVEAELEEPHRLEYDEGLEDD